MVNCKDIVLNVILIFFLIKLFNVINDTLIKTKKKNKKCGNEYETFIENQSLDNFKFENDDMYKIKYHELKNINEITKSIKKNMLDSLNNSINQSKNKLNIYNYDKEHGFPLYALDGHNWNELFPGKKEMKTYNNEEYYKKFSEN